MIAALVAITLVASVVGPASAQSCAAFSVPASDKLIGAFFFDNATTRLQAGNAAFGGSALMCGNASASAFWPANAFPGVKSSSWENSRYASETSQGLVLLPGGCLTVHERLQDWTGAPPLLNNWTFAVDVKIPTADVMIKTHTAQLSTLIPLLHLGADPSDRLVLGFAS